MSASAYLATLREAPLAAYPLGVGLLVTSSLFFGNIGLTVAGPLPLIKEQLGASTLSLKQKIRVWRLFFDEAAKHVVIGTGLTAVLHLSTLALTESSAVTRLASASALFSVVVIPFTVLFISPTNKALISLDDKEGFSETDEKQSGELIKKWDHLHKFRFLLYGGAWASGLAALVAALLK